MTKGPALKAFRSREKQRNTGHKSFNTTTSCPRSESVHRETAIVAASKKSCERKRERGDGKSHEQKQSRNCRVGNYWGVTQQYEGKKQGVIRVHVEKKKRGRRKKRKNKTGWEIDLQKKPQHRNVHARRTR